MVRQSLLGWFQRREVPPSSKQMRIIQQGKDGPLPPKDLERGAAGKEESEADSWRRQGDVAAAPPGHATASHHPLEDQQEWRRKHQIWDKRRRMVCWAGIILSFLVVVAAIMDFCGHEVATGVATLLLSLGFFVLAICGLAEPEYPDELTEIFFRSEAPTSRPGVVPRLGR